MTDRSLATIQRISKIEPIEGADSIDVARILGWNCVVKKNEFSVGDLCVYCEVDSLLPENPEFEFLRKNCFIDREDMRGFRIRTVKLRQQVSQGICFPLSIIDQSISIDPNTDWKEGQDVTAILGIKKWEPKISLSMGGKIKGSFPGFIPKTDETRIQSIPDLLERHNGTYCYVTEKVDGSSVTVFLKDGEIGVCSRNMWMQDTEENVFWATAKKMDIENKMKSVLGEGNWALQGELLGPGIQGNKYGLKTSKILWFNVFNVDTYKYLDFDDFNSLIQNMGLEIVPFLGKFVLNNTVDELVEMSKGQSALNKIHREGIVIRPCEEKEDKKLGRVSFKVINPDFLLKFGE
jgi:RNA ligase (TIGR02306 family)